MVIVLEGYVVLSSELLAIRLSVPFVGSGTDTVSIIIAAVLMPLALGYYVGGRFKPGYQITGRYVSVRRKLIFNLQASLLFLTLGLSYVVINSFFETLISSGLQNRLIMTALYASVFLITPVFLLAQTIPLISNYFRKERLATITGKILCLSTLGSFLGAVFSTLVLMAFIGVHFTAALNFIVLAALIFCLSRTLIERATILALIVAFAGIGMNSGHVLSHYNIVSNNQYNLVQYFEYDNERHLFLNNDASSMLSADGRKYGYIEFFERSFVETIPEGAQPYNILVIGAGGFTFGSEDMNNYYDFVDIDKNLQEISETYILQKPLGINKTFHPMPARAFLTSTDKEYDLIILDAYLGSLTLPEHLVTQEFFSQIKNHLKPNGIVASNFILTPYLTDPYSQRIHNTFMSVFPLAQRHIIQMPNPWMEEYDYAVNMAYIYKNTGAIVNDGIYTDNINRVYYDKNR